MKPNRPFRPYQSGTEPATSGYISQTSATPATDAAFPVNPRERFDHPEPHSVVPIVRIVVVPIRGARIPLIVVERAPAQACPRLNSPTRMPQIGASTPDMPIQLRFIQPPNKRPTSSIKRLACSYPFIFSNFKSRLKRILLRSSVNSTSALLRW